MRHLTAIAAGCAAWLAALGSAAAQPVLDQAGNIEKAAAEIAAVQTKSGADGAFAAIGECYQRELARATSLTRELEACMAQDIIVSKVSAAFYASLDAELRKQAGGPEPEAVTRAMLQRVLGTFASFKVPEDDVRAFNQIVQTRGMEAYGRARFPQQFPAKRN
jgi:hypothetical protein